MKQQKVQVTYVSVNADIDAMIGITEAARMLGISVQSTNHHVNKGRLRVYTDGRTTSYEQLRRYVYREEVERLAYQIARERADSHKHISQKACFFHIGAYNPDTEGERLHQISPLRYVGFTHKRLGDEHYEIRVDFSRNIKLTALWPNRPQQSVEGTTPGLWTTSPDTFKDAVARVEII